MIHAVVVDGGDGVVWRGERARWAMRVIGIALTLIRVSHAIAHRSGCGTQAEAVITSGV